MNVDTKSTPDVHGSTAQSWRKLKTFFTHRTIRRMIQTGVSGYILFLVVQHALAGESGSTLIPSAEAFCPFGGLETLYKYLTGGGSFVAHTHLSNLVLSAAVLVSALLLRSAFCGWICPLGFLQDLVSGLSSFLQRRFSGLRRAVASLKKRASRLAVLDRFLRYLKYLVLAWAVGGASYFGIMVFRDFDPWATLLNLVEFSFTPGVIVLAVILIAALFVERPWCRYACPLGAVSGLVGMLSPSRVKRDESLCTSCKLCTRACPMGLEVHKVKAVKSPDCNTCLECVGSCPSKGALQVTFGSPFSKK